ncbi:hypothetical protein L1987_57463 [Smallanthus sonchifolius]|uniref:Uncharacterized protein n=1 Tax=Smallanthus sonchifolius TaxID=185202 RepID=A0ACB9DCK2_9ASTR|nr:hypothetical protein L1987_57463 [Smallanthus sonchifolius]
MTVSYMRVREGPLDQSSLGTTLMIIESVNEENHTIRFKVIGGEVVDELYKSFRHTFHVEPNGDRQVATWTFEFERPDTNVPYPTSVMDYLCNLVKDLDANNNTK